MRKKIILSGGEVRYMTFEEVLVQFKDMINRTANTELNKIIFNKPEREDFIQELNLQCWEAFKRYDEQHAFSTYLVNRLKLGINIYLNPNYAKKRQNNGVESLNKDASEDGGISLEEVVGQDDGGISSFEFQEFLKDLEQKLNPDEMMILYSLMNKKDFSVSDLAVEWGVSRVAANNRVRKFKTRLAGIMRGTGYVVC